MELEAADKRTRDLQIKSAGLNPSGKDRSSKPVVCHRCGGPYKASECFFQKSKFLKCGKVTHIARVHCSNAKPDSS